VGLGVDWPTALAGDRLGLWRYKTGLGLLATNCGRMLDIVGLLASLLWLTWISIKAVGGYKQRFKAQQVDLTAQCDKSKDCKKDNDALNDKLPACKRKFGLLCDQLVLFVDRMVDKVCPERGFVKGVRNGLPSWTVMEFLDLQDIANVHTAFRSLWGSLVVSLDTSSKTRIGCIIGNSDPVLDDIVERVLNLCNICDDIRGESLDKLVEICNTCVNFSLNRARPDYAARIISIIDGTSSDIRAPTKQRKGKKSNRRHHKKNNHGGCVCKQSHKFSRVRLLGDELYESIAAGFVAVGCVDQAETFIKSRFSTCASVGGKSPFDPEFCNRFCYTVFASGFSCNMARDDLNNAAMRLKFCTRALELVDYFIGISSSFSKADAYFETKSGILFCSLVELEISALKETLTAKPTVNVKPKPPPPVTKIETQIPTSNSPVKKQSTQIPSTNSTVKKKDTPAPVKKQSTQTTTSPAKKKGTQVHVAPLPKKSTQIPTSSVPKKGSIRKAAVSPVVKSSTPGVFKDAKSYNKGGKPWQEEHKERKHSAKKKGNVHKSDATPPNMRTSPSSTQRSYPIARGPLPPSPQYRVGMQQGVSPISRTHTHSSDNTPVNGQVIVQSKAYAGNVKQLSETSHGKQLRVVTKHPPQTPTSVLRSQTLTGPALSWNSFDQPLPPVQQHAFNESQDDILRFAMSPATSISPSSSTDISSIGDEFRQPSYSSGYQFTAHQHVERHMHLYEDEFGYDCPDEISRTTVDLSFLN